MQLSSFTTCDTLARITELASELAVQLWIARDMTSDETQRAAYQRGITAIRDLFDDTGTEPTDVWIPLPVSEPA